MSITKNNILKKFLTDSDYIYKNWRQTEIDNFSTKIFDKGSGPILFITPIAKHLEPFWVPILKHFEKTRRVITYERRESINTYLNAEDRTDDIKRVIDYLGISRCDFVSHSSGAIATLHFALRYPEIVNSLILMNVAAYYSKWQKLQVKILSDKIAQLLPDSLVLFWFLYYLSEKNTPEYEIHKYAFSQFRPLKKYMKYSLNHIILEHDIRSALQTINTPVLLVNRSDDRIVSMADMNYICKNLPNCYGLKKVTGGGHMFYYGHAQEIVKFMEEFYLELKNIKNH